MADARAPISPLMTASTADSKRAVGEPGAASLYPSAFTVATEGYALSRRLYLYLPIENVNPLAQELVGFALSSAAPAGSRRQSAP